MSTIILIEDNQADCEVVLTALTEAGLTQEVVHITDGASGIEYVGDGSRCQSALLFIVDINLPRRSGHDVLAAIRNGPCAHVPVIIMTSSDRPQDAIFNGAHYFRKQLDLKAFLALGPLARRLIEGKPSNSDRFPVDAAT